MKHDPDKLAEFSREELVRYSRHFSLPDVGVEGQLKLKRASVLLVGAGGLGSPAALYLAAAGVGKIGIVEFDTVDATNLQRQILHGTSDVGRAKLESARARLAEVNPNVEVVPHAVRLSAANALEILRPYDVVVDGTDNFATRYLVNDACVLLGKPDVYGSIFRFDGQASVFWAGRGPCYRCLFPEPPPPDSVPNCAEGGVLGVLPGIMGTIQAAEAVKLIVGIGEPLLGRVLLFDALRMKFRELRAARDPNCPVCGERPTITKLSDHDLVCGTMSATDGDKRMNEKLERVDALGLKAELDGGAKLLLLDVREPHEYAVAHLKDSVHIRLADLELRLDELNPDANVVAYCRSGVRSLRAVRLLRDRGFTHVRDLEGGILAWIEAVEPTMPKY